MRKGVRSALAIAAVLLAMVVAGPLFYRLGFWAGAN